MVGDGVPGWPPAYRERRNDKLAIVAWCTTLTVGLLVLGGMFTPILNPPQCPIGYTQAQIDSSNCIIGANIGLGLFVMLGLTLVAAGLIGLLIHFTVVRGRGG